MTHVLVLLPILPVIFITVEIRDNTLVRTSCWLPLLYRPVLTWRSYADAGGNRNRLQIPLPPSRQCKQVSNRHFSKERKRLKDL